MTQKEKLIKRLRMYWQLEIGNVVLVPAIALVLAFQAKQSVSWLSAVCLLPTCGLLLIGGLYWRGKLKVLEGDKRVLDGALNLAHTWQWPLALLSVLVSILAVASWVFPGIGSSIGDRIIASTAAALAVLEYINYYHRQLQHFDHVDDFKRLISGRGFRRAQMAVDLKRWRHK